MAQERYLSPREILSYLCDLERKLPRRVFALYAPLHSADFHFDENTDPAEVDRECQKMLEFAGMNGYTAKVQFCKLDDNTAGNTKPGCTPNGVIHINVSSSMLKDWKAVVATLAHEICHHVIYRYGIRPQNMDWMVETYTDLCTIYVGFGKIILDGYRTNVDGTKRTLGYLDWNTYKVTTHLVGVVCGGNHSDKTGLKGSDFLADDAISIWESNKDKAGLLKDFFRKSSVAIAEMHHNLGYVEQIAGFYKEDAKVLVEELHKLFFSENNDSENLLSIFRCIYEATVLGSNSAFEKKLMEHNETIGDALYLMYAELNKHRRIVFDNSFSCPLCGRQYKNRNESHGLKIIKCGQCGTHFVANLDDWNVTTMQRKFEARKKERNAEYLEQFKRDEGERIRKEWIDARTNVSVETGKLRDREKKIIAFENRLVQDKEDAVNDYLSNLPQYLQKIVRKKAEKSIMLKLGKVERKTKMAFVAFEKNKEDRDKLTEAARAFIDNLDDLHCLIDGNGSIDKATIKRLSDFVQIMLESNLKWHDLSMAFLELNVGADIKSERANALKLLKILDFNKELFLFHLSRKYVNRSIEIYRKGNHSAQEIERYTKSLIDFSNTFVLKKMGH